MIIHSIALGESPSPLELPPTRVTAALHDCKISVKIVTKGYVSRKSNPLQQNCHSANSLKKTKETWSGR